MGSDPLSLNAEANPIRSCRRASVLEDRQLQSLDGFTGFALRLIQEPLAGSIGRSEKLL